MPPWAVPWTVRARRAGDVGVVEILADGQVDAAGGLGVDDVEAGDPGIAGQGQDQIAGDAEAEGGADRPGHRVGGVEEGEVVDDGELAGADRAGLGPVDGEGVVGHGRTPW